MYVQVCATRQRGNVASPLARWSVVAREKLWTQCSCAQRHTHTHKTLLTFHGTQGMEVCVCVCVCVCVYVCVSQSRSMDRIFGIQGTWNASVAVPLSAESATLGVRQVGSYHLSLATRATWPLPSRPANHCTHWALFRVGCRTDDQRRS